MANPPKLLTLILIGVSIGVTFGSIETRHEDLYVGDCNVTLDLTGVGLNTLPKGFVRNKFITHLTLDGNGIPSVSAEAFTHVPNLSYLSLAKNKLKTLNLSPFTDLYYLKSLILNENCKAVEKPREVISGYYSGSDYGYYSRYERRTTTTPPPPEFEYCDFQFDSYVPSLTHLFLERNDIKKLSFGLSGLPNLTHLYLSHNPLDLNRDTLSGLNRFAPNLTHLYLRSCSIKELDAYRLPSVTSLHLDDNEIQIICHKYCEGSSLVLNEAKQLETLSVSNNKISLINNDSFTHMTNLLTLDFSHNKISEIREGTFDKLYKLKSLSLEYNNIVQLSGVEPFRHLIKLENLTLGGNDMSNMTNEVFKNLTSLKRLMLNNTKISNIDCLLFSEMANIETLNLDGNQLSKIPEGSLPSSALLESLSLDNNKFTNTEDISLDNKPNLLSLSLKGNPLKIISAQWILNVGSENLTITFG